MGKQYFVGTQEEFSNFTNGKSSFSSIQDLLENVRSSGQEIPEGGLVVIEVASTIEKKAPKPVSSEFTVKSQRKLGPRKKKADADSATSTEGTSEPSTETVTPRRGRRAASASE